MNIAQFNYAEAALWLLIAAGLVVSTFRMSSQKHLAITAAITFVAFALSDVIEAHTGAWWRPLWLLALKGACVLILTRCYWIYRKSC